MFRNSPWQVSAPALATSWFLCFQGRFLSAPPKNPTKTNFTKLQIPGMLHQFGDDEMLKIPFAKHQWLDRAIVIIWSWPLSPSIHPAASLTLKTTSPMPLGKICSKSLFNISPVEVFGSRGASTSSLWSMKSCGRTNYKVQNWWGTCSYIMRQTYFNRSGFFKHHLLTWNTISRWTCQCTAPIEKT